MIDPLYEVLVRHRAVFPQDAVYVFTGKQGQPLEVNNLRNKVWYPTLQRVRLAEAHDVPDAAHLCVPDACPRRRSAVGHAHAGTLFATDGVSALREVRANRMRRDGLRFTQGLQEAGVLPGVAIDAAETKKARKPSAGAGLRAT